MPCWCRLLRGQCPAEPAVWWHGMYLGGRVARMPGSDVRRRQRAARTAGRPSCTPSSAAASASAPHRASTGRPAGEGSGRGTSSVRAPEGRQCLVGGAQRPTFRLGSPTTRCSPSGARAICSTAAEARASILRARRRAARSLACLQCDRTVCRGAMGKRGGWLEGPSQAATRHRQLGTCMALAACSGAPATYSEQL